MVSARLNKSVKVRHKPMHILGRGILTISTIASFWEIHGFPNDSRVYANVGLIHSHFMQESQLFDEDTPGLFQG